MVDPYGGFVFCSQQPAPLHIIKFAREVRVSILHLKVNAIFHGIRKHQQGLIFGWGNAFGNWIAKHRFCHEFKSDAEACVQFFGEQRGRPFNVKAVLLSFEGVKFMFHAHRGEALINVVGAI